MSRGDRLLIAAVAIVLLAGWPLVALGADRPGEHAVIEGPAGATTVALSGDAELTVAGRIGTVRVAVDDGAVRVADSTCPDLVCVHAGSISAPGSVIACVPNGVVIHIEGRGDGGLDAVVR